MANGLLWGGLFLIVRNVTIPEPIILVVAVALSFPMALPFIFIEGPDRSTGDAIFMSVLIGFNAFVWGYGLSWIWRTFQCPPPR